MGVLMDISHIFTCENWTGDIQETEEMRPQWFPVDNVPMDGMWADDKYVESRL